MLERFRRGCQLAGMVQAARQRSNLLKAYLRAEPAVHHLELKMLRRLRNMVLSENSRSMSTQSTAMEGATAQALATSDSATESCFFLQKLPIEMRVRVYDYLVVLTRRLVPCPDQKGKSPVDTTLFLVNRQIYEEAADVFYSRNRFCVHFEYFCKCWKTKYILHLNEKTIKHFKILDVNFDQVEPILWNQCKVCATDGFALLNYLSSLPNLRSVSIVFANEESFASCASAAARKLRRLAKTATLEAAEIGHLHINGIKALIELRLPVLIRTWSRALRNAGERLVLEDSDDEDVTSLYEVSQPQYRLDICVYAALRDILYHAVATGKTTKELQPFMRKAISPRGLQLELLDAQERAAFTIALVECLSDIISDDPYDANVELADRSDLVDIHSTASWS